MVVNFWLNEHDGEHIARVHCSELPQEGKTLWMGDDHTMGIKRGDMKRYVVHESGYVVDKVWQEDEMDGQPVRYAVEKLAGEVILKEHLTEAQKARRG